jgi:hypothetical protein
MPTDRTQQELIPPPVPIFWESVRDRRSSPLGGSSPGHAGAVPEKDGDDRRQLTHIFV